MTISGDGQHVLYLRDVYYNSNLFQTDLWDTNGERLVSTNRFGAIADANFRFTLPLLSADARKVVFETAAEEMIEGDVNKASDVFARDVDSGATILV